MNESRYKTPWWKHKQTNTKQFCNVCYNRGYRNVGTKKNPKYERCPMKCFPDSKGEYLLAKQAQLERRLEELKAKGW